MDKKEVKRVFAELVDRAKNQQGLHTDAEVANLLSIPPSTFSRLKSGSRQTAWFMSLLGLAEISVADKSATDNLQLAELRKLNETYLTVIRIITGEEPSAVIPAITEGEFASTELIADRSTLTHSRKRMHDGIASVKNGLEDIEEEDASDEKTG